MQRFLRSTKYNRKPIEKHFKKVLPLTNITKKNIGFKLKKEQ